MPAHTHAHLVSVFLKTPQNKRNNCLHLVWCKCVLQYKYTLSNSPHSQISSSRAFVLMAIVKRICGKSNCKFKTHLTKNVLKDAAYFIYSDLAMWYLADARIYFVSIMHDIQSLKVAHLVHRMNSRQLSEHSNGKNLWYQMGPQEVCHCLVHMKVWRFHPDLGQQPVMLLITRQKDWAVFPWSLTQLLKHIDTCYSHVITICKLKRQEYILNWTMVHLFQFR